MNQTISGFVHDVENFFAATLHNEPYVADAERYVNFSRKLLALPVEDVKQGLNAKPSEKNSRPQYPSQVFPFLAQTVLTIRLLIFAPIVAQQLLIALVVVCEHLHRQKSLGFEDQQAPSLYWRTAFPSIRYPITALILALYPHIRLTFEMKKLHISKRFSRLQKWVLCFTYLSQYEEGEQRLQALQKFLLISPSRHLDVITLNGSLSDQGVLSAICHPLATISPSASVLTKSPPKTLQELLVALRDPTLEPSWIVDWCTQNTFYASLLMHSASYDNRQRVTVNDIKQAVLTYGTMRIGDILVRQTLQTQLLSQYFPIKHWCEQFMGLCCQVASAIALTCKTCIITPQRVELLATLSCSSLFTHQILQTGVTLPNKNRRLFPVFSINTELGDNTLWKASLMLAKCWQLDKELVTTISSFGLVNTTEKKAMDELQTLLHLALLWTQQWLLGSPEELRAIERKEESEALERLGLTLQQKEEIKVSSSALIQIPYNTKV